MMMSCCPPACPARACLPALPVPPLPLHLTPCLLVDPLEPLLPELSLSSHPSCPLRQFGKNFDELDSMQRVQVGGTIGGEHRKQQMAEVCVCVCVVGWCQGFVSSSVVSDCAGCGCLLISKSETCWLTSTP
jgi:hypothetical protein